MSFRSAAAAALAIVSWVTSAPASAQTVLTDPAEFRRPAIFMPPDAPLAVLDQHGERTYAITVAIGETGLVTTLKSLEPDDAEFRDELAKVIRFWVFYPRVDPQACATVRSDARVELHFRQGQSEPKVWLTIDPLEQLLATSAPRMLESAPKPRYPRKEQVAGLTGHTFLLVKVGADGMPTESRTMLGLPPSPGFERASRVHAMGSRWDPAPVPARCVAMRYDFILR